MSGLLALMLLVEARRPARTRDNGDLVLLSDQDRTLWTEELVDEGLLLVRKLLKRNQPGPYQIQAAINAVHDVAPTAADTQWDQIVALYDQLYAQQPTPVVAMNRAVAVAEVHGPAMALAALEPVVGRSTGTTRSTSPGPTSCVASTATTKRAPNTTPRSRPLATTPNVVSSRRNAHP